MNPSYLHNRSADIIVFWMYSNTNNKVSQVQNMKLVLNVNTLGIESANEYKWSKPTIFFNSTRLFSCLVWWIYKNHPEQIYKAIKKTNNFDCWWLTRRQVYLNVENPFWYFEHWTPKIRLFVFVGKCIVETLYNTSCIIAHVNSSQSRVNRQDIGDCLFNKDAGFG